MPWLHEPRLRALALLRTPAWLWSLDASKVLWANPTGAAIFGAATPSALAARSFDLGQPTAAQVARLTKQLPLDGTERTEQLLGFGAGIGRALACACSRVALADGTAGILVAAADRAGPDLLINERVTRLLAGGGEPIAIFTDDGTLIAATPSAQEHLGSNTSLASLGADALKQSTRDNVPGASSARAVAIDRLGDGADEVLVVSFGEAAERLAAHASADAAEPIAMAAEPPPSTPPAPAAYILPRDFRHPLRFVWHIDAEQRFIIDTADFVELIGPKASAALGQRWPELATKLDLDLAGHVARALATRETWSGLTVHWPIDGSDARLAVELSGLPVFDRERQFVGYRGFGVCRDLVRLNALANGRREENAAPAPVPPAADDTPAPAENVIEIHAELDAPGLSPLERHAFYELSRRLSGRINAAAAEAVRDAEFAAADAAAESHVVDLEALPADPLDEAGGEAAGMTQEARPFLDRLPIGVLVYRLNHLLYANDAFMQWTGYASLDELAEAGGLDALEVEPGGIAIEEGGRKPFTLTNPRDPAVTAEARLLMVPWDGESAFALLTLPPNREAATHTDPALDQARAEAAELHAILDTATDGVVVLDRAGRILSCNRSAQALFGTDPLELAGRPFSELFATESIGTAIDYLDGLQQDGVKSLLNDGREIIGRERQGGAIPLFMTMGRLGESGKFCAVFRDITPWKKTEGELIEAKRQAEKTSSAKSDFLAKISHEIRTPLNAIIGFSEVMMEERFGAVGNDRYRQYLKDIHTSGRHLISLINDLLDLSKIEAGKLELSLTSVAVNDLVQECVAIMQPQANSQRIIIRTSLSPKLPPVTADARSVRQIVLNLLSNSIKFTEAGGQVIVSTTVNEQGEVVLRVRDNGIGMSEKDIATALEPFRQLATSTRFASGGTGLGLPLTKALAEANHAGFHIKSAPKAGTLIEVKFPPARVMVE